MFLKNFSRASIHSPNNFNNPSVETITLTFSKKVSNASPSFSTSAFETTSPTLVKSFLPLVNSSPISSFVLTSSKAISTCFFASSTFLVLEAIEISPFKSARSCSKILYNFSLNAADA